MAPDLKIDLADPASIERRIPEIEEIVAAKREVVRKAEQELETWDTLLKRLRSVAGLLLRVEEPDRPLPAAVPPQVLDAVVKVVERHGGRMMPMTVEAELKAEGHEVESRAAVYAVLKAAVAAGRLRQVAPRQFVPVPSRPAREEARAMEPVPEAHLGLQGPPPQSKAEAAVRVLGTEPGRRWSISEVGDVMIAQGWMTDSNGDLASLSSTLSRLVADGKIFRPRRGCYQLAPPGERRG